MEIKTSEQPKVILIGGIGRTGTNVLKDVLCEHPAVFGLPFETRITVDPDGLAPTLALLQSCWSPFVAEKAIGRLERFLKRVERKSFSDKAASLIEKLFPWYSRLGNLKTYKEWELGEYFPGYAEASRRLIAELSAETYKAAWPGGNSLNHNTLRVTPYCDGAGTKEAAKQFLSTIHANILHSNKAEFYVDDNTYNVLFANLLFDIIPNSHLIHMIRDPREVALSYREQRWMPQDLGQCAELVEESFCRWEDVKSQLDASWYTEVRLEQLCSDPVGITQNIIARCGLDSDVNLDYSQIKAPRSRLKRNPLPESDRVILNDNLAKIVQRYGYAL